MGRAVTASSSPRCSVASDARAWLFLALGSGRRFLGPARNALHTFSAHRFSPAGCRRGVCMHRGNSPFTSHPQACCLTHRSSGQPPARHLARKALTIIIRLAGQAPSRRLPLSSNVRPHRRHCWSASIRNSRTARVTSTILHSNTGKPALVPMAGSGGIPQVLAIGTRVGMLPKTR